MAFHIRSITSPVTYRKPDPFGACSHLRAGRIHIAANLLQVQTHHPITCAPSTADKILFGAARRTEFLRGKNNASCRGDMAEKDHARARGDDIIEEIQYVAGLLDERGQRHFLDHDAIAFRLQLPRLFASRMLLVGHEHFVPRLQINSVARAHETGFHAALHNSR